MILGLLDNCFDCTFQTIFQLVLISEQSEQLNRDKCSSRTATMEDVNSNSQRQASSTTDQSFLNYEQQATIHQLIEKCQVQGIQSQIDEQSRTSLAHLLQEVMRIVEPHGISEQLEQVAAQIEEIRNLSLQKLQRVQAHNETKQKLELLAKNAELYKHEIKDIKVNRQRNEEKQIAEMDALLGNANLCLQRSMEALG